ncbi:unnamed protein product [Hydatigera taeniaeformis]|uniref:Innexin n=1 Tax=Hydatigena taeniaeformis TaxID=6205 RepID=A0A0R3WK36_HYDTA|nr:unnamed protein product [Hydatigera taeniaeformis]
MVGIEFIDYLTKLRVSDFLGLEDFADKMNFMYSVLILLLCTTIIAVKQYLLASIACYIPTVPSGKDFEKFLQNFCWVHGTIPILEGEHIPQNYSEWHDADENMRINYYQWVPFMLGLQCILFYVPRVVWQIICYNRTGTDLENLVAVANKASNTIENDRKMLVKHVAGTMAEMLFQHRDYRHGKVADARRKAFKFCGMFIASKRLGTWLIFTYLFIKCIYLANAIGQLYLMQTFLGFNKSMSNFGYEVARYMVNGRDWDETRIFPRVSFCYLEHVRHLGTTNRYVAQCVLPVNMLNEKLYIFLWFWTAIVAVCTAISIPLWIMRLGREKNKVHFIKKFLRLQDIYTTEHKEILRNFISDFLRHDGVFLLRMISMNAGDVVTADVVVEMWDIYKTKFKNRAMLNDIARDIAAQRRQLEEGGETTQRRTPYEKKASALGSDFMNFYQKYQAATLIGIQDWADRMSYLHSTIIFLLCTAIVSAKTYILQPLACHVPTVPSGSDFDSYFNSYCWIHGTTPIRANETIPEDDAAWVELENERKITYYQWVPFILGLQTIMFYLPHVAWQNITFNRLGADLTAIVVKAMDALKTSSPENREKMVANVAKRLELLLFAHRDIRRGKRAAIKRRLHAICGIFLVSKRMGTWTVFSYLCIKILYLTNAIGQLYLMKHFLGYDEDMVGFGLTLANSLVSGIKWEESLYFPRIAFCSITIRHLGQKTNRYMGMCALAINMLNEKLYVFLWFWTLAVAITTGVSLINWFLRLAIRRRQTSVIRRYLKLKPLMLEPEKNGDSSPTPSEALDPSRPDTVERFIREFLRMDGVFIVQMLNMNAGDVITGEVIRLLWHTWVTKYADKKDFGNDPWIDPDFPDDMDEIDKIKMELADTKEEFE